MNAGAWRWLVRRLFPAWFLAEYEDSLVETLVVDAADARAGGVVARMRTVLRNLADLLATAWRVRRRGLPPAREAIGGMGGGPVVDPARGPRLLDGWLRDARLSLRSLRRAPGFVTAGVLTIGLGASVSAGMFSVLDRALLQPLPVHDADRLVTITAELPSALQEYKLTPTDHVVLGDRATSIEALAYFFPSLLDTDIVLPDAQGAAQRVEGLRVSPNYFEVLGVRPQAGPGFARSDEAGREVMLSHRIWQSRFGGRTDALGQTLIFDLEPHEIVGILPAAFDIPVDDRHPDYWIARPLLEAERSIDSMWLLDTTARLAPAAGLEEVAAEIRTLGPALDEAAPTSRGRRFIVRSLDASLEAGWRQPLTMLGVAAAVILLMAATSLALLFAARQSLRRQEFAVWMAMGAGRVGLARRLLIEALLVGVAGMAVGVALARWGGALLLSLAPLDIPRFDGVVVDPRLLAFAGIAVVVTAGVAGLAPIAQLRSLDALASLRSAGRGRTTSGARTRSMVVALQCATMTALLITMGLSMASFARLSSVDPGFRTASRYHVEVTAPQSPPGTPGLERFDRETAYFTELVSRVRALPGVSGAGLVSNLPLTTGWGGQLFYEDRPIANPSDALIVDWEVAGDGYFEAAGIDIVRGRSFEPGDTRGQPRVTIVNETMARLAFPDRDPLGQSISGESPDGPWRRVVGIVRDVRQQGLGEPQRPHMYLPVGQSFPFGKLQLVVAMRNDTTPVDDAIAAAVRAVDPGAAAGAVEPLAGVVASSVAGPRFAMALTGVFALLAVVLAAAATWGVISFMARSRRQELALRSALGAQRRQVVATAAGTGLRPVLTGLTAGVVVAVVLGRFLAGHLYGLRPWEPGIVAATAGLLLGLSLGVVVLSAARAARVDPASVFRE